MWWSATSSSSSSVSPHTHHHDTLLPPQTSSTSQPPLGQTQTSRLRRSLHLHIRFYKKKKKNNQNFAILPDGCTDQHFHNEHCTLIRQQSARSATLVLLGGFEGGECWSIHPPKKIDCFCFQVSQRKLFFVSTSKNCHNSLVCPVGHWSCARHPEGKKEILTKINKNWSMFSLFLGSYFF